MQAATWSPHAAHALAAHESAAKIARPQFSHGKGGYYHDGRFATLRDVVDHYDSMGLGLTDPQKNDLVEYLKSL